MHVVCRSNIMQVRDPTRHAPRMPWMICSSFSTSKHALRAAACRLRTPCSCCVPLMRTQLGCSNLPHDRFTMQRWKRYYHWNKKKVRPGMSGGLHAARFSPFASQKGCETLPHPVSQTHADVLKVLWCSSHTFLSAECIAISTYGHCRTPIWHTLACCTLGR